jgi:hypothetical protein
MSVKFYHGAAVTSQNKVNFIGFVGNRLNVKVFALEAKETENRSFPVSVTYVRGENSITFLH